MYSFLIFGLFGKRIAGAVEEAGGAMIATEFAHALFLPLVPLRSVAVFPEGHSATVPYHLTSVAAGYLRGWAPIVAVLAFFARPPEYPGYGDSWLRWALVLTSAIAAWAASLMGRLSADAARLRAVYAEVCGAPLDPAILAGLRPTMFDDVRERVLQRTGALAPTGYRDPDDGRSIDWLSLALDPNVGDSAFVKEALCLARMTDNAPAHAALWAKLKRLEPAYAGG